MAILGTLRDHPAWLEVPYQFLEGIFRRLGPIIQKIGYQRVDRWLVVPERIAKQMVFDCQMCGQCTLHFTGMTCPMTCPKNIRNGPCGGVRIDKSCEVDPRMTCIWMEAYGRSRKMGIYGGGILNIQPPLNHGLGGTSAFVNLLSHAGDGISQRWSQETGMLDDGK